MECMGYMLHPHRRHHHLSEEIIEEIVLRLPVKSIIRFKCVSKSWFSLISSSPFICKHLITSQESFLARVFWAHTQPRQDGLAVSQECMIRTMNLCDIQKPAVDAGPMLRFRLPTYNNPAYVVRLEYVDQCNGIMCFKYSDDILLVNPALKQVKKLPIPPICNGVGNCKFVGFGYDNMTMDFKVVRMWDFVPRDSKSGFLRRHSHRQIYEIYTLSSNSWRTLDEPNLDIVGYIHDCSRSVFLDGVIHWCVGTRRPEWRMLMLNTATELFERIEFPRGWDERVNEGSEGTHIVPDLFVLNQDTLAFASYLLGPLFLSTTYVDIWTMNKEDKRCWTKLYSIGPLTEFMKPLNFSMKDTFLYEAITGKLILYDLLNHNTCVSRLPLRALGGEMEAVIELGECKASLVSLINV